MFSEREVENYEKYFKCNNQFCDFLHRALFIKRGKKAVYD